MTADGAGKPRFSRLSMRASTLRASSNGHAWAARASSGAIESVILPGQTVSEAAEARLESRGASIFAHCDLSYHWRKMRNVRRYRSTKQAGIERTLRHSGDHSRSGRG